MRAIRKIFGTVMDWQQSGLACICGGMLGTYPFKALREVCRAHKGNPCALRQGDAVALVELRAILASDAVPSPAEAVSWLSAGRASNEPLTRTTCAISSRRG
ncbi:hypothetical protein [uncultured Jannaschia sp.]|uniref:hypothetical protein n=1 Tax=uncultured Jannaschia sp. TaxID=293347 RepID=UPI00262807F4|nr:hypothetical protein [uncultured Jannaschia sp.]